MQTLKMKIVGYDEESHSLIVSFASDETASQDPSVYPSYAYQPMSMWPDITDPEELIKRIGHSGIHMAEQQKIKESFVQNPQLIEALKSFVGQEKSYAVTDLIAASESYQNEVNV
jgi:hypothetical protein